MDALSVNKEELKQLIDQETDAVLLAQVRLMLSKVEEPFPRAINELLEFSLKDSELIDHTNARDMLTK